MAITAEQVKALRDKTGAGMMECKAALTETNGNIDEAITVLRKRGLAKAAKRAGRATTQGAWSAAYIHMGGKLGVLVEVNCESDFVATHRGLPDAREGTRDAGRRGRPEVRPPRGGAGRRAREGEGDLPRPVRGLRQAAAVIEKIVEGKLDSFYEQVVPARPAVGARPEP